ncbi:SpoIIE family protein phosphatase [Streptomyces sp. NPDC048577]|uniref:SpoIIE family protein phosphatase n=1 Tax=Streptomyces sp. NPDC048577 TaxID=3157209 RepID=UPI00343C18AB
MTDSGNSTPPPAGVGAETGLTSAGGLAAEIEWLRGRTAHRHLLDLATGMLAAQLRLSPTDAAEHLEALAQATGLAPADLAADIVDAVGEGAATMPGGPWTAAADGPPETFGTRLRIATSARYPGETRRARRVVAAAEATDTVDEAARTLLEGGLAPHGADSLWLWRGTEAGCLRLVGHAGVGASEAVAWQWIPPAAPEPFRAVLKDGVPVWLDDGPPTGLPLPGASAHAARALLPLHRRRALVGLALVGWPGPTALDATVRRALTGLVDVAGAVLGGAETEQPDAPVLVDVLDALARPAMLLGRGPGSGAPTVIHLNDEAAATLGGAPPARDRSLSRAFPLVHADLAHLARRAVATTRTQRAARLPASARPGETTPLLDVRVLPAGGGRAVVLWHTVGDVGMATGRAVARLQSVATFQDTPDGGGTVWSEQAYAMFGMDRTEQPVPLPGLRGRVHRDDGEALTELLTTLRERQTGAQTVLRIVLPDGTVRHVRVAAEPLLTGDTVTGIVGVFQDVSDSRRTEMALTATFDHLTEVRNEAEMRHQMALQLQQAIIPEVPGLQELPGDLVVAARYRPAAEEYRVGGDWYDVLRLPNGQVLVAVGDIAGHGIDSVTGMVALRNAQRALAFTGHPPRHLMGWLNEVTLRTGGGTTATAVCALYDPRDRGLVWSSAGHLPPLLLRDGRARLLGPPLDLLLGAEPGYAYHERRTGLRPGDTLLLYTDGLVERRHDDLAAGLERLAREAERLSGRPPDRLVDGLLSTAVGDTDDDTSLVAVGVRGRPRTR